MFFLRNNDNVWGQTTVKMRKAVSHLDRGLTPVEKKPQV